MEIFDELEGSAIALPLGKDIRFSVFDSDMGNGSSWKLKTHSDTQDVYLYMRDGADWVHTSSHEGGRSHFATTSSPELDDDDKKESDYVDVTFGAQEVHPGWNLIFQIIVPDSSLQTDYVEKVKATKFMKIPVAKNGIQNATLIQIYKVTTALNYFCNFTLFRSFGLEICSHSGKSSHNICSRYYKSSRRVTEEFSRY